MYRRRISVTRRPACCPTATAPRTELWLQVRVKRFLNIVFALFSHEESREFEKIQGFVGTDTSEGAAQTAVEQIRPGAAQAAVEQAPPRIAQAAVKKMLTGAAVSSTTTFGDSTACHVHKSRGKNHHLLWRKIWRKCRWIVNFL